MPDPSDAAQRQAELLKQAAEERASVPDDPTRQLFNDELNRRHDPS